MRRGSVALEGMVGGVKGWIVQGKSAGNRAVFYILMYDMLVNGLKSCIFGVEFYG